MKRVLFIFFGIFPILASSQQVLTLEECYKLAERNYPLAKQSALFEKKINSEIKVLEKAKLPKLDFNAQATYQSDVIAFPIQIPNSTLEPPNKDQYRATLDANQLIYNGGHIAASTKLKVAELATQQQKIAVDLYTLKNRINQYYFSVLLLQEQNKLLLSKMDQLNTRLKEVSTGVKFGAVLPSSKHMLQAEILKLEQQLSQSTIDREKAMDNLSLLLSQNLNKRTSLENPDILLSSNANSNRPELEFFNLQQKQLESSKEVITKANYPKLQAFAQAGYGNPGLNMLDNSFQDFYMAGLKLNWNIFDWGQSKEKKQAVDISKEIVSSEKETFLLNTQMQQNDAASDIRKYSELIVKDEKIVVLREHILKSATSQFQNGTITSSQYIIELNNLYEAKIDQQLHHIQLTLAKANYKVITADF